MLVKFNIFLEKETLKALRLVAKKKNLSVSEVVRRLMKEAIERNKKSDHREL